MNRLQLAILGSTITMFVVLITLDLNQLFITPLTAYGINHWLPELLAIFLVGRWLVNSGMKKPLLLSIIGCVFVYPLLTYALMSQMNFGIGTSSIFVAMLIAGIWTGSKNEEVK